MLISQESMSFQFSPADIVLSCTICQDTFSTIYADGAQDNGLRRDDEVPHNNRITKLWLTECAHLTCGRHLPGGGAPFHSIHEVPRAPCPLCSIENDDHSDKALFFINGISKGQYDVNIPDVYFQMPPIQLSGGDPGLEALRFQYLSLLRSGTKMHEKLVGLTKALQRWEDKKPEIVRSLSSVAPLRDELLSAGRRLMALGEDVSSIETTLKLAGVSLSETLQAQRQMGIRSQYHLINLKPTGKTSFPLDGGSRLARGSAADLDSLNQGAGIFKGHSGITQQESMRQNGSFSKRKRVDSRSNTEQRTEYAVPGGEFEKCLSRDQMPPPPIPMQQPFIHLTRVPYSEVHGLKSQHDNVNPTHFQRAPITPQRHSSQGGLSRLIIAPSSSMEPSNSLWAAGTRTNDGKSSLDHGQSPSANTGTPGSVYAGGGWQPPPVSFDTECSGSDGSPSSSLPSTGQQPARHPIGYHQASVMFPIELGDRTIDPSSRSYQPVSSDRSVLYDGRRSALTVQSQLDSAVPLRNHNPSPNREGRITLSVTPSFASRHSSDRGIGLSSHVRSSSCQTNHQSASSSSYREQFVNSNPAQQRVVASAHFSARQPTYINSLPSLGGPDAEKLRRNNSDSGPTPVNGEMRPFSSTNGETLLLARDPRPAQNRSRIPRIASQASSPRCRANR